MKTKKILAAALIGCICGFTACSNDEETGNLRKEVKILTSVNGNATAPQLRASIDPSTGSGNLENGDSFTFMVWDGIGIVAQGIEYPYTIGTTEMYWDDLILNFGNVPLYFQAFYPEVDDVFELQDGFNAATATYPDLLSAHAPGVNEGETVSLAFYHIMHKLTVNLSSNDYNSSQLATAAVKLKNLKSSAKINMQNGVVDITEAYGTDPYPAKTGVNTTFIVAPQTLPAAGTDLIEIAVEGKTFTYKIPTGLTVLESGKVVTLNLELKKNSGTVGDSGSDFNPGGGWGN